MSDSYAFLAHFDVINTPWGAAYQLWDYENAPPAPHSGTHPSIASHSLRELFMQSFLYPSKLQKHASDSELFVIAKTVVQLEWPPIHLKKYQAVPKDAVST